MFIVNRITLGFGLHSCPPFLSLIQWYDEIVLKMHEVIGKIKSYTKDKGREVSKLR